MTRALQHPVVLLVLCFALVGTPVTYRGGASNPHPHMFFEFLIDAAEGSFDHHHGDASDDDDADAHGHAAAHLHEADATGNEAPPPALAGAERFAPSLSAFVVGDVGQLALVVPQHDLPTSDAFTGAFSPFGVIPTGLTHAPTAPPPR